MYHSLKNRFFVLVTLLALAISSLGVTPAYAAILPILPTVSTDSIETLMNRQVNATLSDLGDSDVIQRGVAYNTTGNPNVIDDSLVDIGGTNTAGSFTVGLDPMNLTPGTLYYVRAFAINGTGISYGTELQVYGPPGDFAIIQPSNGATYVPTSITLAWEPSEAAEDYEYCIAADITDCTSDYYGPNWISTGGATSVDITDLLLGTEYSWGVRAVVGDPASYKWFASKGGPVSFTTTSSPLNYIPLGFPAGWNDNYGQFNGMWGADANNVYAVGHGNNGAVTAPLIYYSDGINDTWFDDSPAIPDGYTGGTLRSVWGSGTSDIYAVGYGWDGNGQAPLLYHYDGSFWSTASLPLPGTWTYVQYNAVWGTSADDVYIGGAAYNDPESILLLFHWDGIEWTDISPELPGFVYTGQIESIWGSSSSDIYAAGWGYEGVNYTRQPMVLHFDGNSWTDISPGLPDGWDLGSLYEVWGSGLNDVYVVGDGHDTVSGMDLPMILYYDGSTWYTDLPALPSNFNNGYLKSIWGSGASDIYAVGHGYDSNANYDLPMLFHNDGSGWTDVTPSLPLEVDAGFLYTVWGSSANNIYAAGRGEATDQSLLMYHYEYQAPSSLTITPSDLDFGDQLFRTSNPAQQVTVENTSGSTITLDPLSGSSSVGTTADTSKSFFISNDTCSNNELLANEDCTFDVTFLPWSLGAKTGSISIPSDAFDSPHSVSLTGNSVAGTQLLLNRSFENVDGNGNPNLWSRSPLVKIGLDGTDLNWAFNLTRSMKFVGDGDLKIFSQQVNKSGVAGDDFSMFVVTKGDNIPTGPDRWLMQIMFYNGATIVETRNVSLLTGTHENNRKTVTHTAAVPYTHVVFRIHFGKASGTAWVDLASLQWAP